MRRDKFVKVSLSETEYEKLTLAANSAGVSPSEFLRDVVKTLSTIHPDPAASGRGRDSRS